MRRMTWLVLAISLASSGCYQWHTEPTTGGGPVIDGAIAADGGAAPSCEAQDAVGDGLCDLVLGWSFDGTACVIQTGCDCSGSDCDALFESERACVGVHAECLGVDPCGAQDARGEGACRVVIGVIWDGRQCATISGCECVGADCGSVFGSTEECRRAHGSCGPETCVEQALPDDDCDGPPRSFGWRWNGGACEEVLRCSCSGAACDSLFASHGACADAFATCPGLGTDCDPSSVACRIRPPVCREGSVPSVIDRCWGPCVPFAECAPIECGAAAICPAGLRCSGDACVR